VCRDPATGLGSINFRAFYNTFANLGGTTPAASKGPISNGGIFGVVCTAFMACVMLLTYYWNFASINAMLCCKQEAPVVTTNAEAELNKL
jgi:hypothetical protein